MITQINIKFAAILLSFIRHIQDRERVLTEEETAYLLGLHPETLKNYRRAGKIEYFLLPGNDVRYARRHYEKFLADCEAAAENRIKARRIKTSSHVRAA